MGFRRNKASISESRAYQDFFLANEKLIESSGVPISLCERRELFDDLLMHGYIDHHDDPTHFSVEQLSTAQLDSLVEVVVAYLRAGFPDPGIAGIMGGLSRDEIFRRAGIEAKC